MSAKAGVGISKLGSPAGIGPTTAIPCAAKSNAHESPIAETTIRSAAGSFAISSRRANNAASDTALTAIVAPPSDDSVETSITATSGEDEGKIVAAASSITVDVTNGATTAVEDLTVSVYGFIRKRPHVAHGY